MNKKEYCPMVDMTCNYESCQWWDEEWRCCVVKTIAREIKFFNKFFRELEEEDYES